MYNTFSLNDHHLTSQVQGRPVRTGIEQPGNTASIVKQLQQGDGTLKRAIEIAARDGIQKALHPSASDTESKDLLDTLKNVIISGLKGTASVPSRLSDDTELNRSLQNAAAEAVSVVLADDADGGDAKRNLVGQITRIVDSNLGNHLTGLSRLSMWQYHRKVSVSRLLYKKYGEHYSYDTDRLPLTGAELTLPDGKGGQAKVYEVAISHSLRLYPYQNGGNQKHPSISPITLTSSTTGQYGLLQDQLNALHVHADSGAWTISDDKPAGTFTPIFDQKTVYICFIAQQANTKQPNEIFIHDQLNLQIHTNDTLQIAHTDVDLLNATNRPVVLSYHVDISAGVFSYHIRTGADYKVGGAPWVAATSAKPASAACNKSQLLSLHVFDDKHTDEQRSDITLRLYEATEMAALI